ncbi:Rib/alpha-like domain-containing protein [Lactobacillus equicursoris]|uniref:Rib/alpha-like domain-containing protein n=1 Tax=Lactobacillus equicursoris TaxID=420645 RepID=UPI00243227F3|nr:Rib/alpha-like domain-containing protein [Lactobacillus equicursoris]MDD6386057.1 Rib/alpha-like domain-containing protein [Lactobacillus equicursoris]
MKKLQKAAGLAAVSLSLLAIGAEPLLNSDSAYVLAAKKATKKSTKTSKAKKTKKSSKKTSKKSTKRTSVKKTAKKAAPTKKSTKRTSVKKTAKKAAPTKKSTKKTSAKKTAKKVAPTKKSTKKTSKKVVKATTKTVKKRTPIKKTTVKKQTLAKQYQPKVKTGVVKLTWGGAFAFSDAQKYITNADKMPSGTYYQFEKWVDTYQSGKQVSPIKAYYTDGSSEVVGSVTFQVPEALAVKYAYFVQDLTVPVNGKIDIEKDIVTDSTIPANAAKFYFCKEDGTTVAGPDTSKAGRYEYHIKAVYTDGSIRLSGKITVNVE